MRSIAGMDWKEEMPNGVRLSSNGGQFADWTLAINFSVPLGLRGPRATLRRQELILDRDWANLRQAIHAARHDLAISVRNIDQFYDQYDAFRETREAAKENLEFQSARYRGGFTIFLNVLQAIANWGDAVSSEAQTLTQYNIALAGLEAATGTILESHSIRFLEERSQFVGPLGRLGHCRDYPSALRPGPSAPQYPVGEVASEQSFNLTPPVDLSRRMRERELRRLPPPPKLDVQDEP